MIYQRRAEIYKAFKLLEGAIEQKQAELKEKIRRPEPPDIISNFVSNSLGAVNQSLGRVEDTLSGGQVVARLILNKMRKEIDRNPWGFLGKVAVCGIALGLILGTRRRNQRSRVKS